VSPAFAQALESGDMRVTGWDEQGKSAPQSWSRTRSL
jgi:hypothetical protein